MSSSTSAGAGAVSTADLQQLDRAHLVHPHQVIGHPVDPVVITRAEGSLLWDSEGREYIDGTCGLWQCAVGHGRQELARAAADQMGQFEFYSSFWDFSNQPAIELAARLAALTGDRLSHVHFTSGGSEGNEVAVKLVRL